MDQQVDRVNLFGSQIAATQPEALTGTLNEISKGAPTLNFIEPEQRITFLTQDIAPTPAIQLAQDRHRAKFTVSDQENSRATGDQLLHIGQQGQLLSGAAVSS